MRPQKHDITLGKIKSGWGKDQNKHDITLGKIEIPRGQLGHQNHISKASLYKDTHPSRQIKYREVQGTIANRPLASVPMLGAGAGEATKVESILGK